MNKLLVFLCVLVFTTVLPPSFVGASELLWDPPTTGNYDGFKVTVDDTVITEYTQETSINIDNINLVEGQTYTFKIYAVDMVNETQSLIGAPVVLTYVHREPLIMPSQDLPPPAAARIVIDVNINISQPQ